MKIKEFWEKRNKVLFTRVVPALGDFLMHRMIFEDVKLLNPELEVHFACPLKYHSAVIDHPFIDKVLDFDLVNKDDYLVHYNNDTACEEYEEKIAPHADKHRSDIWAEHCGFELTRHEMHIRLTDAEKQEGRSLLQQFRHKDGPIVLIAPISTRSRTRSLTDNQLGELIGGLHKVCPIVVHSKAIDGLNTPIMHALNIRQLLAVVNEADYIISVDTGTFHCAGGLHKPVVGIFTSADGYVYSKYYNKVELVQKHRNRDPEWTCGPCYTWTKCPKTTEPIKPCLTELTAEMIIMGLDKLMQRFPCQE
jgi:ADP-heptose:LPS heptosyltransferase